MRPNLNKESLPNDTYLLRRYREIEENAVARIRAENISGNGFYLQRPYQRWLADPRYSISAQILVFGSPVHIFLSGIQKEVRSVESNFHIQPETSLHITIMELAYSEVGKKGAGVTAEKLRKYHKALFHHLPNHDPSTFRLHRIFPTLDKAPEEQDPSVSLVASFLTDDDPTRFMVRSQFEGVVDTYNEGVDPEEQKLKFQPGNPKIDVILVTLGKFVEPPDRPLLETIMDINRRIPQIEREVEFSKFNLITTATGYAIGPYLIVEPPIYLEKIKRLSEPLKLLRP